MFIYMSNNGFGGLTVYSSHPTSAAVNSKTTTYNSRMYNIQL